MKRILRGFGSGRNRLVEETVKTPHSFTGRMCAASRWIESKRKDSLFHEPQAYKLAGREGRSSPMGEWIMVRRTRFGDDLLQYHYTMGARQLVLLGAGFDARSFRMNFPELNVFEVDQQTTFDVKEPLLQDETLTVSSRHVVPTDFTKRGEWANNLIENGFNAAIPTVWLLEGLVMYLSMKDTVSLMKQIGKLSSTGSVVFHDAVSANYVSGGCGPVVGGAKFIGGSDVYAEKWDAHGGFRKCYVRNIDSIRIDRRMRALDFDDRVEEATPGLCFGRELVLFVTAEKVDLLNI